RYGDGVTIIVTPRCNTSTSSYARSYGGISSTTVSGGTSAYWRRSAAQRKRRGDIGLVVAVARVRLAGRSFKSCWRRTFCLHPRSSTLSDVAMQGSKSDAPEWCRDSGYRGTVCVNCARTGLWGVRLGNRWLYPEGDGCQRPLVP